MYDGFATGLQTDQHFRLLERRVVTTDGFEAIYIISRQQTVQLYTVSSKVTRYTYNNFIGD